jgi:hypothetical protein
VRFSSLETVTPQVFEPHAAHRASARLLGTPPTRFEPPSIFFFGFVFVFVSPSAGGWFARVLECASDAAAADRANRRARGGAAATAAATTAFGRERVRAFETRSVREQVSSFRVFRVDGETGSNVAFAFARDR